MALELAGDVGEWILLKISGKEVTDLKDKLQSSIVGGTTLNDLEGQLVKLKADQDKIIGKLDTILSELEESSVKSKADDAKNDIRHSVQYYDDYIAARKNHAEQDSWLEIRNLSADVDKQLFDYHSALVDHQGISPGLIELTVVHYWDKYEKGLSGESLKYDISSVRRDLIAFIKHITGIQLIGLHLQSLISHDDKPTRQQHIIRQSVRFEKQALTFKDNIPSCVDIHREDCHEFLTRSHFRLQWWTSKGVTDEYLCSAWAKMFNYDPGYFLYPWIRWSALKGTLPSRNPDVLIWKFEKLEEFYYLVGYYVLGNKEEVKVAADPEAVGEVLEPVPGKIWYYPPHSEYATNWKGETVLFKVILMRSKMKRSDGTFDNKHKPIVRIVDTKWPSRKNEVQFMFNSEAKSDYYYHQMNYI